MEGYLIWLIFLALAILSISIIQFQAGRSGRLQEIAAKCRRMFTDYKISSGSVRRGSIVSSVNTDKCSN